MGRVLFYTDYIVVPALALALLHFHLTRYSFSPEFVFLAAVGLLAWTLLEYILHRLAHVLSFLRADHARHHAFPTAQTGPSGFVTLLTYVSLTAGVWVLAGAFNASAGMAGMLTGYTYFLYLHRYLHRVQQVPRCLAPLKEAHDAHHRGKSGRFGVTTRLWDWLIRF